MTVATDTDFEVLFKEQYPRLVALGIALTSSGEVANDLAQETLARAHANWEHVSDTESPAAWLRTVMKNLVIDHYRREATNRTTTATMAAAARRDSASESANGLVDDAASMLELLELLPQRQRLVVALRYVDDLGLAEIGAVLGIATGTVKATLWKARRTLERHLRDERST